MLGFFTINAWSMAWSCITKKATIKKLEILYRNNLLPKYGRVVSTESDQRSCIYNVAFGKVKVCRAVETHRSSGTGNQNCVWHNTQYVGCETNTPG
jgi:hypothetical protein